MNVAKALWIVGTEKAEIRETHIDPQPGEVAVDMLFSGISRGTERLVYQGQVPPSEHDTMRAPFQEGAFSFPVKYGYSAVGRMTSGEVVFALFPHQNRFTVPGDAVVPVPDNVPAERAILAANMETALNITWDAQIGLGDRVVVIGCGVVGALTGYLASKVPGTEVTMVDIDPGKQTLVRSLGCKFALPNEVAAEADLVIHASATSQGLATAIGAAGLEARIVEASWYGKKNVEIPLGGVFHQRRLQIVSSQVGRIPAHQAARWTYRRRMEKALSLLGDPSLDVLISGETPFDHLADAYGDILKNPATLCHRVVY